MPEESCHVSNRHGLQLDLLPCTGTCAKLKGRQLLFSVKQVVAEIVRVLLKTTIREFLHTIICSNMPCQNENFVYLFGTLAVADKPYCMYRASLKGICLLNCFLFKLQ